MDGEYDASDSADLFIQGPLTGRGFTCVTAPVIYAAIGRRLGYPIKLVHSREHTFCRWNERDGERFNIEATSLGLTMPPDAVYCKWPKPITPEEVKRDRYLYSLSPREELAFFIAQRGCCCMDNLETFRAMEAFYYAHKLVPDLARLRKILGSLNYYASPSRWDEPTSGDASSSVARETHAESPYYAVAQQEVGEALFPLCARTSESHRPQSTGKM